MRECQECGSTFNPAKDHAKFCSVACRKAFNNRRAVRGAALYDYYMAMRYERKTHGHGIAIINQMASAFRDEDKVARGGRHSWATPDPSGIK